MRNRVSGVSGVSPRADYVVLAAWEDLAPSERVSEALPVRSPCTWKHHRARGLLSSSRKAGAMAVSEGTYGGGIALVPAILETGVSTAAGMWKVVGWSLRMHYPQGSTSSGGV
jgi:hypothetical protein